MLHDNAYKIDFYKLGVQLLPTAWRTPIQLAFVKMISLPFSYLLRQLKNRRNVWIYKLTHSASIGKLQKVANDHFDTVDRRIEVVMNYERKDSLYTFFPEENRETLFTYFSEENKEPLFTYFSAETSVFVADFFVLVPIAIGLPLSELKRLEHLIRDYAKKDKHFTIKLIP